MVGSRRLAVGSKKREAPHIDDFPAAPFTVSGAVDLDAAIADEDETESQ